MGRLVEAPGGQLGERALGGLCGQRRQRSQRAAGAQVHSLPEGAMLATVIACESALVQAAMAMFEKLGLKLNSLTSQSPTRFF